jgi:hypothetical protein
VEYMIEVDRCSCPNESTMHAAGHSYLIIRTWSRVHVQRCRLAMLARIIISDRALLWCLFVQSGPDLAVVSVATPKQKNIADPVCKLTQIAEHTYAATIPCVQVRSSVCFEVRRSRVGIIGYPDMLFFIDLSLDISPRTFCQGYG